MKIFYQDEIRKECFIKGVFLLIGLVLLKIIVGKICFFFKGNILRKEFNITTSVDVG